MVAVLGIPVMRKKRGRPSGKQRRAEQEPGPTKETAAKLVPDVLLALLEAGLLTLEQERAGREIKGIWEALERAMNPPSSTLLAMNSGTTTRLRSGPEMSDGLTPWITRALHYRHQPWAGREIERAIAPHVSRYGVAWRVCYLNWPVNKIAAEAKLPRGVVLDALRDTLDVYLRFAETDGGVT